MDLETTLSRLNPHDKALFLANVIHDVTVYARLSPPEKLRDINNFVHRMNGYLKDVLYGDEWADNELIAETITDHFRDMQIEPSVAGWLPRNA